MRQHASPAAVESSEPSDLRQLSEWPLVRHAVLCMNVHQGVTDSRLVAVEPTRRSETPLVATGPTPADLPRIRTRVGRAPAVKPQQVGVHRPRGATAMSPTGATRAWANWARAAAEAVRAPFE